MAVYNVAEELGPEGTAAPGVTDTDWVYGGEGHVSGSEAGPGPKPVSAVVAGTHCTFPDAGYPAGPEAYFGGVDADEASYSAVK